MVAALHHKLQCASRYRSTDGSQQPCGENSDLPSNQVCSTVAELKASAPVQAAQREEPGGMVPA